MADAPNYDVYSGDISAEAQRLFTNGPTKDISTPHLDPITFSVGRSGADLRVDFGRAVRALAATTVTTNYTFTGPSALTTTGIVFTPGNTYLILQYSGTIIPGTYNLTLAAQTVQSVNDDLYNITTGVSFDGGVVNRIGGSSFNSGFN